ncbi:hypothetical protein CR513_50515, partial [Mucuna pruriens]
MKDVCDRRVVENMVNDLMVHRKEEFLRSAQPMAMLAHNTVSPVVWNNILEYSKDFYVLKDKRNN